jgi:hypothetical protein
MAVLLILLLLVIAGCLGYLLRRSSEPIDTRPLDPETELQTALRLHDIRRKLDVADLKHQQRRDANRLRRELRETLKGDE